MKILQIIPGLTLGGPTFSVTALSRILTKMGNEVQLYTEYGCYPQYKDIDLHFFKAPNVPFNSQFVFSYELYQELKKQCGNAQIIQTNSLWQFPNIIHEFARKNTKAKSVIVPRGTLSEYALSISPLKKKIVLALGQKYALNKADLFIATCYKEYEDIRRFGIKTPIAIIPNGITLPDRKNFQPKIKNVSFLARIHKIKGVDLLLRAWKVVQNDDTAADWSLKIGGPINSEYAKKMIQLSKELGCDRVEFVGEKYENDKIRFLSSSAIYILPTHSENFGITVAEALSCETPVITTKGAPWEGLETNQCGLWTEISEESIIQALRVMMSKNIEELSAMGCRGRNWIERDFSWEEIAKKTLISYKWLLNPNEQRKPDWILLD